MPTTERARAQAQLAQKTKTNQTLALVAKKAQARPVQKARTVKEAAALFQTLAMAQKTTFAQIAQKEMGAQEGGFDSFVRKAIRKTAQAKLPKQDFLFQEAAGPFQHKGLPGRESQADLQALNADFMVAQAKTAQQPPALQTQKVIKGDMAQKKSTPNVVQMSAKEALEKALQKKSANAAISFIKETLSKNDVIDSPSERRSLLIALGDLEEASGAYKDAKATFVKACAISAADGVGMKKRTNEELVLDAARCALCIGEGLEALNFLASGVRNSKDEKISAKVRLYEIWAKLVLETSSADTKESIALLKTYADIPSMNDCRLAVLFTLWYVTGEESWGKRIIDKYKGSVESKVVKGDVAVLPSPFWYFIPHKKTKNIDPTPVDLTELEADKTIEAQVVKKDGNGAPLSQGGAKTASPNAPKKAGGNVASNQNSAKNPSGNLSKTGEPSLGEENGNKKSNKGEEKPTATKTFKAEGGLAQEKALTGGTLEKTGKEDTNTTKAEGSSLDEKSSIAQKAGAESKNEGGSQPESSTASSAKSEDEPFERAVKLQMGLFKGKSNAENLVARLKDKGFDAYMTSVKRASGTTYFLVFVDEDAKQSMGLKLKSAGFECYPIFE